MPVTSTSVSPAPAFSIRVARAEPPAAAKPCTSIMSPTTIPASVRVGIESSNIVSLSTVITCPAIVSVPATVSTACTAPWIR